MKASIVAKYAHAWARIMSDFLRSRSRKAEVAYVDLFCGPGSYEDGTPSTPSLILKKAIEDPKLASSLRTYFNDIDPFNVGFLDGELTDFPGREKLKYQPALFNEPATLELVSKLAIDDNTPRLYFLDQFGYKHVTLKMIATLLSTWGSECIFFFNYRRVIAALDNPAMVANVRNVFGSDEQVKALRDELSQYGAAIDRERIVMFHLAAALRAIGAKFIQTFSFKAEDSHRSTHHLVFVTKHPKGYELMKGIMARAGTQSSDGIPSMSFILKIRARNLLLFERPPLEVLSDDLLAEFEGQTLTVSEIFLKHGPRTNFVPENYRTALLALESRAKVVAIPDASLRPMRNNQRTMSPNTRIVFRETAQ